MSSIISEKSFIEYEQLVLENKINEAKDLLLEEISDDACVYQYMKGIRRDLKTLVQKKIWLCKATKLNDPYDCAFLVNKRSKLKYDVSEIEIAEKDLLKQIESDNKSFELQNTIFIGSFSETYNSSLMWSYYASDHKGICVGYKLRELVELYNCFPVIYTSNIPKVDNELFCYLGSLTKSKSWAHELEWRIIRQSEDDKEKKGFLMDFVKPVDLFLGCKHKSVGEDNANMMRVSKDNNLECDENLLFISISEIMEYSKKNKIRLHDFKVNPNGFELIKRDYNGFM